MRGMAAGEEQGWVSRDRLGRRAARPWLGTGGSHPAHSSLFWIHSGKSKNKLTEQAETLCPPPVSGIERTLVDANSMWWGPEGRGAEKGS